MDTMNQGEQMSQTPIKKGGGMGPIIGIVIIIILLALGGYYVFTNEQEKRMEQDNAQEATSDMTTENLKVVGSSDTSTAIESDLNATDVGSSESDLQGAEGSF